MYGILRTEISVCTLYQVTDHKYLVLLQVQVQLFRQKRNYKVPNTRHKTWLTSYVLQKNAVQRGVAIDGKAANKKCNGTATASGPLSKADCFTIPWQPGNAAAS